MLRLDLSVGGRWRVLFTDDGRWRLGVYRPENESLGDIEFLERHDVPELFYLVRGRVVLVVSGDGVGFEEVELEPGYAYVVTEWHNAYRPGGCEGVALVVEASGVRTEYRPFKAVRH